MLQLLDGWAEFRGRTWLWVVVCQFFVINAALAGGWSTLGPVIARDTFGRAGWGVVSAALTFGMLLGGLVLVRLPVAHMLRTGVALAVLVAPSLLVLGLAPSVPALVVAVLVGGAAAEVFEISWQVSIQDNVPEAALGRVFAFEQLGTFAAIPLGQLAAGPLAQDIGVRTTAVAAGVLTVVTSALALAVPSVRSLRQVTGEAAAAAA